MSTIRSFRLFEITALLVALLCAGLPCRAQLPSVPAAEQIEISLSPLPFDLKGFLRRPEGTSRFPAVVLLPACGEYARLVDEDWGARISSWGYVALTIDEFRSARNYPLRPWHRRVPGPHPRCVSRPEFPCFKKIRRFKTGTAVVGFAWGAMQTISAVEHGEIERASEHKFRAAAAFFPLWQLQGKHDGSHPDPDRRARRPADGGRLPQDGRRRRRYGNFPPEGPGRSGAAGRLSRRLFRVRPSGPEVSDLVSRTSCGIQQVGRRSIQPGAA